jgi:sigma-B regulation protein RsbU (phosphoserine phosphatase)
VTRQTTQEDLAKALEDENRRLKRAVQELSTLNDLALAIGASLDFEHVIGTITSRSVRAVRAEQGMITLIDRHADQDMRTLVRTIAGPNQRQALHLEESLLGWIQIHKRPLLINDPRNDTRFPGVKWDRSIRSVLCVPLLARSELIGVLTVYNGRGTGGFSEEDQRLLSIVAAQSAQIVENARLYKEERALRRVEDEIRLASEIQMGLLPEVPPSVPGYEIASASFPAEVVGGDYFDFIIGTDGDAVAICLGDVSGKGLSAALLMANLQATIRGQALLDLPPRECVANANELLARSTDPEKFATFFYGVLDPQGHVLAYSNAGHDPPLLVSRQKGVSQLETGGLVLGFLDHFTYEEASVSIAPGDLLVAYSDGVTEATNGRDEPFGSERFLELLRVGLDRPVDELIGSIVAAVRQHAGDAPQSDDITIVAVKREGT